MSILKYFKNQFKINNSINTVEKNNVVYTAYYHDIGDGYSSVECIISTLFNNQKHSFSIDAKIPNKLIKNDKPVILPVSDEGKDFVVFAFPEEQEKLSVISCAPYQVDLESNSINAKPYGEKTYLSNNARLSHSSNKYHSYSKPKAIELPNGDIIIAAVDSNSEGQYVTAWLLERGQNLEFNVGEGSNKVTNRLLFKIDENVESSFQLLPAKQNSNVGKIIYSDSTSLFSLDVTKSMIDNIRDGKYVNNEDEECLFAVGKERCDQFDKKISTPFLTSEEISNLSAVNTKNGAVVAFLENKQRLCLAKLTGKKGKKQIVHNYKERIKSLQLSVVGESDIIVSAVGEKNITQSTISSNDLKVVTTKDFPTDGVKTLDDFVNIVYNNLVKLTTSFPHTIFSSSDAPQISSEAGTTPITFPLSTTTTEEITTRRSTTAVGEDTTSAATTEVTTQLTTTEQKTTDAIATTASTVQPTTTASPKTTTSTEVATTTAETTVETSTAQHTTTDQSTIETTIPTVQPATSSKITTLAGKTTAGTEPMTNRVTKTSTTKPTTKPTAKSTVRSTNNYTTSTKQGSTTTETQRINSTAALGLTTLASTIGSAVVTTLGLVMQNVTNMITAGNNSMITDSSSDFNQTDVSSNYEEKSLSTAEISAAALIPISIVVIGGIFIYRCCCRSNIRPLSYYTDNVGYWQRFKNCLNGQRRTNDIILKPIGNSIPVTISESGISNNTSSPHKNLLDNNKNNDYGTPNPTFTIGSDSSSEASRSRSGSEKSTNFDEWDYQYDTNSAQYKEEDETAHSKIDVSLELNGVGVNNGAGQSCGTGACESKV